MSKDWFEEELYEGFEDSIGYKQLLLKSSKIISKKSNFQNIEIFKNPHFGKVLALDGVVQTTEADEFFYHEMFVHVPLFSHGNVKKVLIIGGGDGGILREVLKHNSVEKVLMIEIDGDVIDLCSKEMPSLNNGAFNNPRVTVRIDDGINYVKNTIDKFDIIIVDSTDPLSVGEPLFTDEFYENSKKCLNKGGIMTTQSGVPFFQSQELKNIHTKLGKIFTNVSFYIVPVPTYVGSFMCLSFATNNASNLTNSLATINKRFQESKIHNLHYYNSAIHMASFTLPEYINKIIK